MAVVIKKRTIAKPVEAEPIVELDEVVAPRTPVMKEPTSFEKLPIAGSLDELRANPGTMRAPDPTTCSTCGHLYGFPCHGKSDTCQNAKFARSSSKQAAA